MSRSPKSRSPKSRTSESSNTTIIPLIKREAYYIPTQFLTEDSIDTAERRFHFRFYNEQACNKCEYLPDRHSDMCDSCSAFTGNVKLASIKSTNKGPMLKLPLGAREQVIRWMKKHDYRPQVIDKLCDGTPIKPFKLTVKPYTYQIEAVRDFFKLERGVIDSPPRTGKTFMGAMAVRRLKVKTLVIAHQRDWLDNFKETFVGSDSSKAMTNIHPKRVGFCKKVEDFEKYDVCFATFQQFFSKSGQKVLKKIKNLFGLLIVDEIHQAPATVSARVLATFPARYRLGLTGSPDRKDQRFPLVSNILGPVAHRVERKTLRPRVELLYTGLDFDIKSGSPAAFTYMITRMEAHKERRDMLIKKAIAMAEAGHFVLLPVSRVKSVQEYVRLINQEAEEDWARPFLGGMKKELRKKTIDDARKYKFRILVGNISLISTGLNIPRASCLIYACFSNNLPKATQRFARVLTEMEGKPDPVIVLVLDEGKVHKTTRRNEFWNCLYKQFNPLIDQRTFSNLKAYLASADRRASNFIDRKNF